MSPHCFVPGCDTGYKTTVRKNKTAGNRNYSLFKAPNDPFLLKKWRVAISRGDRILSSRSSVCEVHFRPDDVERFFKTKLVDGTMFELERARPLLKKDAVPCIFPNRTSIKQGKKLPVDASVWNIQINEAAEFINAEEKGKESQNLTFDTFLSQLDDVLKPNDWWSITNQKEFVMCARWNAEYVAEKRVAIDKNLVAQVFVGHQKSTATIKMSSIKQLTNLLHSIENITCSNPLILDYRKYLNSQLLKIS